MYKSKIRIGKGYVHYMEITYPKVWKNDRPEGCPLCNQEFQIGDHIAMVITNNTFPNTMIHTACIDHDLILTTHALLKSFEHFSKFIQTHRGWCSEELKYFYQTETTR